MEPYLQDYKCFKLTRFYKSSSSSISSFSSVETYLISFSFQHVTCTPPPNFSTDLAFLREWFLWRLGGGGAVAPPLATPPWLRHWFPVGVIYLKLLSGTICCHLDKVDNGNRSTCHKLFQQDQYRLFATSCYELVNVFYLM